MSEDKCTLCWGSNDLISFRACKCNGSLFHKECLLDTYTYVLKRGKIDIKPQTPILTCDSCNTDIRLNLVSITTHYKPPPGITATIFGWMSAHILFIASCALFLALTQYIVQTMTHIEIINQYRLGLHLFSLTVMYIGRKLNIMQEKTYNYTKLIAEICMTIYYYLLLLERFEPACFGGYTILNIIMEFNDTLELCTMADSTYYILLYELVWLNTYTDVVVFCISNMLRYSTIFGLHVYAYKKIVKMTTDIEFEIPVNTCKLSILATVFEQRAVEIKKISIV